MITATFLLCALAWFGLALAVDSQAYLAEVGLD